MSNAAKKETKITEVSEHTVEIITNSGEGAQKCAQIFGQTCAKMGNGVWTVEIIPAEIEPPHHTVTSTSGNIIRFGTDKITNWGDQSKLAIAFNEQVLLSRHRLESLDDNCIILQEAMWENHEDELHPQAICETAMEEMSAQELSLHQRPHRGGGAQDRHQPQPRQEHVRAGHAGRDLPAGPVHHREADREHFPVQVRKKSSTSISSW